MSQAERDGCSWGDNRIAKLSSVIAGAGGASVPTDAPN